MLFWKKNIRFSILQYFVQKSKSCSVSKRIQKTIWSTRAACLRLTTPISAILQPTRLWPVKLPQFPVQILWMSSLVVSTALWKIPLVSFSTITLGTLSNEDENVNDDGSKITFLVCSLIFCAGHSGFIFFTFNSVNRKQLNAFLC